MTLGELVIGLAAGVLDGSIDLPDAQRTLQAAVDNTEAPPVALAHFGRETNPGAPSMARPTLCGAAGPTATDVADVQCPGCRRRLAEHVDDLAAQVMLDPTGFKVLSAAVLAWSREAAQDGDR